MDGPVTLFEKNDRLGKKLYLTGKGRCNIKTPFPPLNSSIEFRAIINFCSARFPSLTTRRL